MNDRYNVLVKQLMEERNINEELKEKDQMKWVQEMNNIRNAVNGARIKTVPVKWKN